MTKRMSQKQKMRYVGICFAIFVVLLFYTFFNNKGMADKSARQLCMYAVSEDAAKEFEAKGYDAEMFETFLQDPFTDPYYKNFIAAYREMEPEAAAEEITAERMRTDSKGVADELLNIYTTLGKDKNEGETEGSVSRWESIRRDTYSRTLEDMNGVVPYTSIVKTAEQSTED